MARMSSNGRIVAQLRLARELLVGADTLAYMGSLGARTQEGLHFPGNDPERGGFIDR